MTGVSVIIVNWNTSELLRECLLSIKKTAPELDLEVLVVDNLSSDDSVDLVRRDFPWVHLIQNRSNLGFAKAVNLGWERATREHLLVMNPDVQLHPECIQRLSSFLEIRQDAGAVSPRLVNPDGTLQTHYYPRWPSLFKVLFFYTNLARWSNRSRYLREWFSEKRLVDKGTGSADAEQLPGACFMTRKSVLARVGGMDGRFFVWFEDVDWFYRLGGAGYRLCCLQTAAVTHLGGQSFQRWRPDDRRKQFISSMYQYFQKHHGPGRTKLLKAIMIVDALTTILYHSVKRLLRPKMSTTEAIRREIEFLGFIRQLT